MWESVYDANACVCELYIVRMLCSAGWLVYEWAHCSCCFSLLAGFCVMDCVPAGWLRYIVYVWGWNEHFCMNLSGSEC